MKMKMRIPAPQQQIDFSFALAQIRSLFLQDALLETIEHLDIARVDHELNAIVPKQSLKSLARQGMRGELVFPVPCLLQANPRLLGYYRLLLGFSQKGFYATETGVSRFKGMEDKGILSRGNEALLPELCAALIQPLAFLIAGIGPDRISREFLDDLTLLTVGPQLKGGANNKIGIAGTVKVFEIIHDIVRHASVSSTAKEIEILNAAGRKVLIEFASDPDIIIREQMDVDSLRNIIAIEIKAGTDFSNITTG
ncbi:MAG: XcyI family restriction endonuclease [Desulfuromonadales bacterium]